MKLLLLMAAFSLTAATCSLRASAIEFSGYLRSKAETRILVSDLSNARSSGWLLIGQEFQGYTIAEFDPSNETVTLKKGSEMLRLTLKQSKVADLAGTLIKEKALSIVQNGDVLIGGLPVALDMLPQIFRQVAMAQPTGRIGIAIRYVRIGDLTPGGDAIDTIIHTASRLPTEMRRFWFTPEKKPNKAPEPTPGLVTPRGCVRSCWWSAGWRCSSSVSF